MSDDLAEILGQYSLAPPVRILPMPRQGNSNLTKLVSTAVGDFVWKTYSAENSEGSLRYEHELLAWLSDLHLSFTIPAPIPSRTGETLIPGPYGWQALIPRLPGANVDPHDVNQVQGFGAILGELQTALRRYATDPRKDVSPLAELHRAHRALPEPYALRASALGLASTADVDELFGWFRDELEQVRSLVKVLYPRLPWQVSHRDYIPNNVLFLGNRICAVLDFEFTSPDVRLVDVAMGLMAVMRIWENPEPWPSIEQFCRGYCRCARLELVEVQALPSIMRLNNAWSTLWWLGRARLVGNISAEVRRIVYARQFVHWLSEHESRLVDAVHQQSK